MTFQYDWQCHHMKNASAVQNSANHLVLQTANAIMHDANSPSGPSSKSGLENEACAAVMSAHEQWVEMVRATEKNQLDFFEHNHEVANCCCNAYILTAAKNNIVTRYISAEKLKQMVDGLLINVSGEYKTVLPESTVMNINLTEITTMIS